MYTYVQTQPPAFGYCTQARPGADKGVLSRAPPARHSESYMLLKEEGAGEKKGGVWSVLTDFYLIPPKDLDPHLLRKARSPPDPA